MKIIWSWIIINDKRVLLIKRSKNKWWIPNIWVFPWWWAERNETPEETTIREVKEEVWLDFKIEKFWSEDENWKWHFYQFLWTYSGKVILQEEECDGYGWFTYIETKYLPMIERHIEILWNLYEEGLLE